jgi:hypothetical protein
VKELPLHRRHFLRSTLIGSAGLALQASPAVSSPAKDPTVSFARSDWLKIIERVAGPVLRAASIGELQQQMPVEAAPGHVEDRRKVTHLEAIGRTLAGLAPWLEHGAQDGDEGELRRRYAEWARAAIAHGVDKSSTSWLRFGEERQTIVDAAFLALAMARAPQTLCASLPADTKTQLANALRATRRQTPPFNNWLLFAAMIEAALHQLGEDWDRERVDYALREIAAWYVGDGVYGDGPHFHDDYYNSFVIHPFLLAVLDAFEAEPEWRAMLPAARMRAARYAVIQERTIAPDGSYPPIGRSLAYRCGAFHLLADAAYRQMLPPALSPGQVRCALSATIQRTLDAPGTFDERGWLRIGLCGHQPSIGETYISTGSLYLCTAAFLPLGLSASDRFWAAPDAPWTAKKAWNGADLPTDHAIDG